MLSKFGAYWVAPICALPLVLVRCFYWTTRVSQCQLCGQQVLSPMGKTSFGEVYLSKRAKLKSLLLSLSCSLVRKPFIVHSLGCCKQSLCATDMQGKHNLNCWYILPQSILKLWNMGKKNYQGPVPKRSGKPSRAVVAAPDPVWELVLFNLFWTKQALVPLEHNTGPI